MWTLGGEILTDQWDFRLNGYITEDEVLSAPELDEIEVKDRRLVYKEGAYASMNGLDIEVGKRFTDKEGIFNDVGIYAKLYRFFESSTETMTGRQLRVDKQFGERDKTTWNLGLEWRDDNIRGSDTEATFAVSIPFGGDSEAEETADKNKEYSSEEILEARMTEQPKRDLDIVVGESDALQSDNDEEDLALDYSGGVELGTVWYVTAEGDGDGSREDPISIDALRLRDAGVLGIAEPVPGENDVIILLGDDGPISAYPIELLNGQKLLSPGGYITVAADAEGSRKTLFRPEGQRAELNGYIMYDNSLTDEIEIQRGYPGIITLADNTAVSGLKINTDGYYGEDIIVGYGVSGEINITNNIINENRAMVLSDNNVGTSDYQPSLSRMGNAVDISARPDENGNTNINIIGNDISARGGISVETRSFAPKSISGLAEIEQRSFGDLNINISNNKINNTMNSGIIVQNYEFDQADINIVNNEVSDIEFDQYIRFSENTLSVLESIFNNSAAVGVYNYYGLSADTNISGNTINDLYSSYSRSAGIEIYNDTVFNINNKVSNNNLQEFKADNGVTQGIAVYNVDFEFGYSAAVNEQRNINTLIEGNSLTNLKSYGYENIPNNISAAEIIGDISSITSGILSASILGTPANNTTIINDNNITDMRGEVNSGILTLNSSQYTVMPGAQKVEEEIGYFDTKITNNTIKFIEANYLSSAVTAVDYALPKAVTTIQNNSISAADVAGEFYDYPYPTTAARYILPGIEAANFGILAGGIGVNDYTLNIKDNELKDIYNGTGVGLLMVDNMNGDIILTPYQENVNISGNNFNNMNHGILFLLEYSSIYPDNNALLSEEEQELEELINKWTANNEFTNIDMIEASPYPMEILEEFFGGNDE
jgi:hypothetical protein